MINNCNLRTDHITNADHNCMIIEEEEDQELEPDLDGNSEVEIEKSKRMT